MQNIMKQAALVALLTTCAEIATTQAADFYEGKRVTIVVGAGVGGSYDLYGRLLAEYLGKFIPGNPNVIVENRVGAGSRTAMTHVYRVAPKDGTVIALGVNLLPFDQFVFSEKPRQYDVTKFQWLGNMASLNGVIAVWHTAGVKSFQDMKTKAVVLGANSRTSETFIIPAILNELAGTKFQIVHGYPGNVSEIDLAIEKGEVAARGGSWASFRISHPDWVSSGKIIPILQNGVTPDPNLPGVPLLLDLAENDEQKAIFRLLSSGALFSRAFWVAPEVPADRVAILRKAFMDTVQDPDFVKYATSKSFEITPSSAEELMAAMAELQQTVKPEYVARIRPILEQE